MSAFTNTPPFTITLNSSVKDRSVQCQQLECQQLLRNLPGKRLVYTGTWQQQPVIVKLFLDSRSARRHWTREKAGAEALSAAHVATPELLYSGDLVSDEFGGGTPVLIFALLPDAQTALEVWDHLATPESRGDFLRQLVELIAELHDAGLEQEDLHLENFLVSDQQLYAIDGDAITVRDKGKALDLKISSRNLALFFAQLLPKYDFLLETTALHYAQQRNLPGPQLLAELQLDLPNIRRKRRHKYIEKCYRTCSEFVRSQGNGQLSIARRDMQGEALSRFLDDPDTFITRGKLLKDGNSTTVVRVQVDDCDWVIKRYNIKNPWHALRRCFRPTRAWISWGNAHLLKISGIATPRAIAVLEKRIGPLRSTGYYVCDFVAGLHAEEFFQDETLDATAKGRVAENFVQLFSLFHQLNFCHGDCKATNFLIKGNELWVLDLDAMHECSSSAGFQKLFQADRERFLRNWQSQPELQLWFDEHLPG
jgi:tRNA A-37 threonylcarbamoyl transferase component Bud32